MKGAGLGSVYAWRLTSGAGVEVPSFEVKKDGTFGIKRGVDMQDRGMAPSVAADVMIRVDRVVKRYRNSVAVNGISFEVMRGDVCGFLGPNGAGKTTTLRMLLGLTRPSSGRVEMNGVDVHRHPVAALADVGAIIEESRFYPYLTGEENLRQALRARGLPVYAERIAQHLANVGLTEAAKRRVKGYSLGMRQRLALALAQLQDPAILILDEPMNGLDPAAMRDFRMRLLDLAHAGVTILLSSHILSEVEQVATRLIFVNNGAIVGMDDMHRSQESAVWVSVENPDRLVQWLTEHQRQYRAGEDATQWVVTLQHAQEIPDLVAAWARDAIRIHAIRPYTQSLEGEYLKHMGGLPHNDAKETV